MQGGWRKGGGRQGGKEAGGGRQGGWRNGGRERGAERRGGSGPSPHAAQACLLPVTCTWASCEAMLVGDSTVGVSLCEHTPWYLNGDTLGHGRGCC